MINFISTTLFVRPDAAGVLPSRSAPIDRT
jgi:hypothetical protein